MNYLSPSILAADFAHLAEDVTETASNGAEYIHIDIMDGVFVPNISFGFPVIDAIRPLCNKVFDVHLMITQPERYIEKFINSGADIITFHIESTNCPEIIIETIHSFNKKVGIALKPATPIEAIKDYLSKVDMVLVMTVEPGFGGQKLMVDMIDKARRLKELKKQFGHTFDIEADGGITLSNVNEITEAGINVVVAGSSVFEKGKIAANTREFMRLINK